MLIMQWLRALVVVMSMLCNNLMGLLTNMLIVKEQVARSIIVKNLVRLFMVSFVIRS